MPTTYTPAATNTQSPSPTPGPGVVPLLSLPVDADALNSASIYQPHKTEGDFLTHIQSSVRLDTPVLNAAGTGFTAVTTVGLGGTVTPSGSVHNTDGIRFMIKIIVGGAVGTATFQTSMDGGNTFGATQTTAASMTDATSGITLAFAGTFTANGTAAFRSAFTPLAQWSDQGGNIKSIIDHRGYGKFNLDETRIEWLGNPPATIASNPAYNVANPVAAYPAPFAQLPGTTTASSNFYLGIGGNGSPVIHFGASFLSVVFETELAWSSITATNTTLGVGFIDGTTVSSPNNGILLQRLSGGTNWQCQVTGLPVVTTTTPPVVGTNPLQRVRIEVDGSTSPYGGGTGKARFYLNEVILAEISGAIPNVAMWPAFAAITVGGSAASVGTSAYVGPTRLVWNRQLGMPAL